MFPSRIGMSWHIQTSAQLVSLEIRLILHPLFHVENGVKETPFPNSCLRRAACLEATACHRGGTPVVYFRSHTTERCYEAPCVTSSPTGVLLWALTSVLAATTRISRHPDLSGRHLGPVSDKEGGQYSVARVRPAIYHRGPPEET